jgi:hypothetical protein
MKNFFSWIKTTFQQMRSEIEYRRKLKKMKNKDPFTYE